MTERSILRAAFRSWRDRPFAWGTADCLAMCGAATTALAGADPTAALRARYHDEATSRRVMVEEGWRSLADAGRSFGAEIPAAEARAGDWALVVVEGVETLGVVVDHLIVVRTETGTGFAPLTAARVAFRAA